MVGRLSDQTVACIFKVSNLDGKYYATLVNIEVLGRTPETKPFSRQAADIKRLINLYDPREVVLDTNGLGVGLGDEMIRAQFGEDGTYYPPYGFINDEKFSQRTLNVSFMELKHPLLLTLKFTVIAMPS